MINIIGGQYKKAKILVPKNDVRPTSAIKREAIFSILESLAINNSSDLYKNKCFIDLFAGSGSLGLEALSRGALFSYFYEIDNEVLKTLKKNCNNICEKNMYLIKKQDSTKINNLDIIYPVSSVFIDPPYRLNSFDSILKSIIDSKILDKESTIVIETDNKKSLNFDSKIKLIKEKNYGKTKIYFLRKN